MPIPNYGVLAARPVGGERGRMHYHLRAVAGATHFRITVNVHSDVAPSELRYVVVRPFEHPLRQALQELVPGFTALASRAGGLALDFVREPPFDARAMRLLPGNRPGPNNDLEDVLGQLVEETAAADSGRVFAFGSRWGPEPRTPDRIFRFRPGNGVHNVHMNQGNHPQFADDDGIWQDGALFLQVADNDWAAVFLAFQSQSWRTDPRGHRLTPWRD